MYGAPVGFAAVADVRPIRALHYDLDVVGSLDDVAAPPYDVIDLEQRAALSTAPPTTRSRSTCRNRTGRPAPQETEGDPYETAAQTIEAWREAGALLDDPEPAIWAMTQDYTGPDGEAAPATASSAGSGSRTSRRARCCPTSAPCPGPKKDRLDLTRATRHNLSPIFSLSTEDPWPLVEPAIDPAAPGARRPTRAASSPGSGGSPTRRCSPPSPSCCPAPSC